LIRGENLALGGFLTLAAAFSGWVYLTATHHQPRPEESAAETPDTFAEQIVVSTLDNAGQLRQRLWVDYSEHFPRRDTTTLRNPYLELYRNDGPPWRIRARKGVIIKGGERVELTGKVEFHRAAGPANKRTDAFTDAITFWPERDFAETTRPVRIEQPGLQETAVGMHAYLDQERVELLKNVHAIQQPRKRKP